MLRKTRQKITTYYKCVLKHKGERMDELLELYNSLVTRDRHRITEFDGTFKQIQNAINERLPWYPPGTFIPVIAKAKVLAEQRLQEDCASYDISFLFETDIVDRYKAKLAKINLEEIFTASAKVDILADEFYEELVEMNVDIALYVKTGTRGNPMNLFRQFVADGYKIDSHSRISKFTEESLMEGYKNIEDEFASSQTARNALIINASNVSKSGYIARRINYITKYVELSEVECQTTRTLEVEITTSNRKRYLGRTYINPTTTYFEDITPNSEPGIYHLYSPLFCEAGDKKVCPKCYGENASKVSDYRKIGLFSSTALTEKLTQTLLSSKHMNFVKFIPLKDGVVYKYTKQRHTFQVADFDEIEVLDDNKVRIEFSDGREIEQELPLKELVVSPNGQITSEDRNIYNADMSFLLKDVQNIFNKTGKMANIETIEEYYIEFINLMQFAKINIQSIHIEIILSAMTRVASNYRMMSTEESDSAYSILSVNSAILEGSSNFDALCFERIKTQLANPSLYNDDEMDSNGFEELFYGEGWKK